MQCSPDLHTTVDFGNNLVNYIEVSADDLPQEADDVAIAPGAPVSRPDSQQPGAPGQADAKAEDEEQAKKPAPKTKPVLPAERYTSEIPQYLVDLDKAEESTAYQYAAAAIEKLPTPPSLPGFLGKPILNAATPMKDDNSVLTMPNHTVLNHLATSSIKNNILAVSATTRYKRKVSHPIPSCTLYISSQVTVRHNNHVQTNRRWLRDVRSKRSYQGYEDEKWLLYDHDTIAASESAAFPSISRDRSESFRTGLHWFIHQKDMRSFSGCRYD